MAENSLLIVGKGSLGAVSLPTERIDVCLLPPAADPHDSPRPLRYDGGWLGGGLSAWMSLNSGSSSSSSPTGSTTTLLSRSTTTLLSRSTTTPLLVLLLLAAVCALNMWHAACCPRSPIDARPPAAAEPSAAQPMSSRFPCRPLELAVVDWW